MEHIVSFPGNNISIQPADLHSAKSVICGLIDMLARPFTAARPLDPESASMHSCSSNRHCSKHGVSCPRFSPVTPV